LQTQNGNTRSTEVVGIIKLAVNHWRVTKQRVLPVSTLHEWRKSNTKIKNNLPTCPTSSKPASTRSWKDMMKNIKHNAIIRMPSGFG